MQIGGANAFPNRRHPVECPGPQVRGDSERVRVDAEGVDHAIGDLNEHVELASGLEHVGRDPDSLGVEV